MLPTPRRREIDHRTIKLVVGVIALTLANLTSLFAQSPLESISAAYYETGWSSSIFTGFLFAIAAFLLAYNGYSQREMVLSKIAALAALGVALFPCKCGTHDEVLPHVHEAAATTMFLILAYLCHLFRQRALEKGHPEARTRATIYRICGAAILLVVVVLGIDAFSGGSLGARLPRLTFYGERTALIAFGISWLTASRIVPGLARSDERFSPLRAHNPAD